MVADVRLPRTSTYAELSASIRRATTDEQKSYP
jgi:hypothetical protein